MTRFLGALLLAFAAHSAPAQDAVPPEDARAVRAVIEAQLDAFRRDDAARAFSLATPGIRATFGDAETFMEMVPPVLRRRLPAQQRGLRSAAPHRRRARAARAPYRRRRPRLAGPLPHAAPARRQLAHQRLPARALRRDADLKALHHQLQLASWR